MGAGAAAYPAPSAAEQRRLDAYVPPVLLRQLAAGTPAPVRTLDATVVCYESPHRILASLEAIGQVFGETEIVVAREMTKQFEEIVRGTAAGLRERFASGPVRGEFTVVIPPAPDRKE